MCGWAHKPTAEIFRAVHRYLNWLTCRLRKACRLDRGPLSAQRRTRDVEAALLDGDRALRAHAESGESVEELEAEREWLRVWWLQADSGDPQVAEIALAVADDIGEDIQAVVLKIDKENERFSLGVKQLEPDPWQAAVNNYPLGLWI